MRNQIIFNGLCLAIALVALGVALYALVTGAIEQQGVDGLFLILVSLLIALCFSLPPVQALRGGLLQEILKWRAPRASEASQGAAQSPQPGAPEKT